VWRSTVQKFSGGGSGFDPGFSETEKVRVVGVDKMAMSVDVYPLCPHLHTIHAYHFILLRTNW